MEEGAIDADAVKEALNTALSDEEGFSWEAFTSAMGEGFDSDAFLQSVAEKLGGEDATIDAAAVSDAIEAALGEQEEPADLSELAKALKDAMGEDFSVEKLTEALTNALKGEDGEAPALDSIVSAVTDAMGGELTNDQITELVRGLYDSLGENLDTEALVGALSDAIGGDVEVSRLLESFKKALGEDFELNLDSIVSGLLGEGADLGEVVSALKDMDFSTGTITDLLFGGELTYQWWSHVGRDKKPVTSSLDSNIYSGEQTRTLTVTRTTVPVQDEVYNYYCVVKIGDKDEKYESPEAELTIKTTSAPVETPDPSTPPTTPPTGPVLDNVTHTAYINGYEDGTVHPTSNITRAEVAKIIYSLMTEESRAFYYTKVNVFSDVPGFEWFNEPVSTLARASVLTGYEDGTFLPNAPIKRAELATILTRLSVLEKTESEGTPANFKDLAGHWAAANVRTAAANGWVTGYPDGTFRPDQYVTRAEAVTMVNRMLGRNPEVLTVTTGMNVFSDNDPAEWYYIQIQEAANGHDYVRDAEGHEMWTSASRTPKTPKIQQKPPMLTHGRLFVWRLFQKPVDDIAVAGFIVHDALHIREHADDFFVFLCGGIFLLGDDRIEDLPAHDGIHERHKDGFRLFRLQHLLCVGMEDGSMSPLFGGKLLKGRGVFGVLHLLGELVVHEHGVQLALLGEKELVHVLINELLIHVYQILSG